MTLEWQGGMAFEAEPPTGVRFKMDGENGPSPIEAFCASAAACSAIDVVTILEKMRQTIATYHIDVEWTRGPEGEWPRPVTSLTIRHILTGPDLDPEKVAKAVALSDEKYCSVMASLRQKPELISGWIIEPFLG